MQVRITSSTLGQVLCTFELNICFVFVGDGAADSDTNSHCALLVDEVTASPPTTSSHPKNPNGNNNYELHEFHSGAATSSQRQTGRLSKPDTEVNKLTNTDLSDSNIIYICSHKI